MKMNKNALTTFMLLSVTAGLMTGCLFKKSSSSSGDTTTTTSTTTGAPTPTSTNQYPAASVLLTAGSTSQTVSTCFALSATAIGTSGSAVYTNQDTTFTLAATSGTGTFYSNSGCTSSITSATISQGSSSKTIYFKSTSIENVTLQATYSGTGGTAWSGTIYGTTIPKVDLGASTTGISCIPVSVELVTSGGSLMSVPYPMTVTLTQTSGNNVVFYTNSNCSSGAVTSGSTTTLNFSANQMQQQLYGYCASAYQNFVFTSHWSYTTNSITTSGSYTSFYQNW